MDFQNVWHTTFSFVKSNDYKNANSTISRLIMRTNFLETKDIRAWRLTNDPSW